MKLLIRILVMSTMLMPYAMAQETRFFSLFINNSLKYQFTLGYKGSTQFDSFQVDQRCIDFSKYIFDYGNAIIPVRPGKYQWLCGGTTNNHYDGYANIGIGISYNGGAPDYHHTYWDSWDVNANDDPARIRIHDENNNTRFDWVAKDNKDYKSIYTIYILNDDGSYSETMIKREDGDNRDLWNIWSNPVDLLKNTCWSDSKGCSTTIHQANS